MLPRACFRHQLGRCAGVCAGKESVLAHHARLSAALARLKAPAWPHRGPVGIVERDRNREATDVHVVHHWCHVGTARSDEELAELLAERHRPRFDYEQYRILARHLGKQGVRVIALER
jgi:DNA polymerase-3 subunit epsilon